MQSTAGLCHRGRINKTWDQKRPGMDLTRNIHDRWGRRGEGESRMGKKVYERFKRWGKDDENRKTSPFWGYKKKGTMREGEKKGNKKADGVSKIGDLLPSPGGNGLMSKKGNNGRVNG